MNHYEEFGLTSQATAEEISLAHKNLARLLHPDQYQDGGLKHLAECQMKRVNAIYEVLSDPARRRMYDLQLAAPPVLQKADEVRPAPYRSWFWLGGTVLAICGIYAILESQAAQRVVIVERPREGEAAPMQPSGPVAMRASEAQGNTEQIRQLANETRELRHMLRQVMAERDQAQARLSSLRSSPAIAAANLPQTQQAAAGGEVEDRGSARASAPGPAPVRRKLAGTWIYVPSGRPSPNDVYPAEYIELVIGEQDGLLWGRYRARFRVTDRALSPEVEFRFEGRMGAERFPWTGNGGAKGEVQLKPLSETAMSVDWFTSQFGRQLSLSSGTAVLVRRAD
ncbi:MAG: J domain-containing protein [Bryobacteraceae bacterium]